MDEQAGIRRGRRWFYLLLICVLIVAGLGGIKAYQIRQAIQFAESFPERSEAVTALTASVTSWPKTYRTIGELRARQFVELRNEVDGVISRIGFTGGERVDEAALLIQLDASEEQAQLQASEAELRLAELQLQRLTGLKQKKLASQNEYDTAVANKNVLLANIAALKVRIAKKSIKAPFAGDTELHDLQLGQYLAANTLISTLSGVGNSYWVDFKLPQEQSALAIGSMVEVYARSLTEEPLSAKVVSADAEIDSLSRNRGFRALLEAAPATVRPGAVVDVKITQGEYQGIVKLPATAVRRSEFGAHVYVLLPAEDGAGAEFRAAKRKVTVGPIINEDIIILSGLQDGELIATLGAFKLNDGLLVHRVSAPKTRPASLNVSDVKGVR